MPLWKVLQKLVVFIFSLVTNIVQVTYHLLINESEMGVNDAPVWFCHLEEDGVFLGL